MGEAADAHKRDLKRRKLLSSFEERRRQIAKENELVPANEKFISQLDDVEAQLKSDTIGLVHLDDFEKRRKELERGNHSGAESQAGKPSKKRKKAPARPSGLSFDLEEDEVAPQAETEKQVRVGKKKNPDVDTSFLPDREREEQEQVERERLKKQWLAEQDVIKGTNLAMARDHLPDLLKSKIAQKIPIVFSFYDGTSHRGSCEVQKGDTIHRFLEQAKAAFPSLRGVPADNLIYVKEDLIIPHHYTFYEFIINKARGKSGPLFNFDVYDDIRLVHDATLEKNDSHAGKICERSWYERHKHIFPASRWEMYDPNKVYDKYTVKDKTNFGAQSEGKKVQLAFQS